MTARDLVTERIYRMQAGDFAEFSYLGGTGMAIFHPPGEPDMQSCFAISPDKIDREATPQEAAQCRRDAGCPDV